MKKFLLSGAVIGVFTLYALHNKFGGDDNQVVVAKTPNLTNRLSVATSTPVATLGPSPVPSSGAVTSGKYKNGNYIGSIADAFYGNVQVQVTISGGKISDVQFLQSPNDRQTSIEINSQAMPLLKQEAIQVQSAQVDGVSGATATSQAFIQSLGSALQQAS